MRYITLFLCLALGLVTGCGGAIDLRPKPAFLQRELDFGPPDYRQGYKDGCETMISARGNNFYKSLYSFKQNTKLMKSSRLYSQAWKDGSWYCYIWVWQWYSDSNRMNEADEFLGGNTNPKHSTNPGWAWKEY